MKRALITGITGQDGAYLARFLLGKGYAVHGIVRRSSTFSTERLADIYKDPHELDTRLLLHYGDMSDSSSVRHILAKADPDEIYNLAAQSHVMVSFQMPEYTADVNATGTLRVLEAIRDRMNETGKAIRFYQAGSSEMFGATPPPQSEKSAFRPRSPYGASKVAAHLYAVNYRESYGLFICNGILFNHESPYRGETFVTRKITRALTRIKLGLQDKLYLGNLESRRDWGYAADYVEAMWMMLQQTAPDDYVVATGEQYSVQEFLVEAATQLGLDWAEYAVQDERYVRPAEVDSLLGDPSKARRKLGWRPKVDFKQLVGIMIGHDLELARRECAMMNIAAESGA